MTILLPLETLKIWDYDAGMSWLLLKGTSSSCPKKLLLMLKHRLENWPQQPSGSKPRPHFVLSANLAQVSTAMAWHQGNETLWSLSMQPWLGLSRRGRKSQVRQQGSLLPQHSFVQIAKHLLLNKTSSFCSWTCVQRGWVNNWFFSSTTKLKSEEKIDLNQTKADFFFPSFLARKKN